MGCDLDHGIGCDCGGHEAAMARISGEAGARRIQQLEAALRVAYGQVQFYRKERAKAWDGDFVRLLAECALSGEPEPGDDWRNHPRLRAANGDGIQKAAPERDNA